jgi:tetratricopeptide (TPR) repeat protein
MPEENPEKGKLEEKLKKLVESAKSREQFVESVKELVESPYDDSDERLKRYIENERIEKETWKKTIKGMRLIDEGNLKEGSKYLDEAFKAKPEIAYYAVGRYHIERGFLKFSYDQGKKEDIEDKKNQEFKKAEVALRNAIKEKPELKGAHYDLISVISFDETRKDDLEEAYKEAIRIFEFPYSIEFHERLIGFYNREGRLEEAKDHINYVLNMLTHKIQNRMLPEEDLIENQIDKAGVFLMLPVHLRKPAEKIYLLLGQCYEKQEKRKEAKKAYELAKFIARYDSKEADLRLRDMENQRESRFKKLLNWITS